MLSGVQTVDLQCVTVDDPGVRNTEAVKIEQPWPDCFEGLASGKEFDTEERGLAGTGSERAVLGSRQRSGMRTGVGKTRNRSESMRQRFQARARG